MGCFGWAESYAPCVMRLRRPALLPELLLLPLLHWKETLMTG
jgi:hypothetical protein